MNRIIDAYRATPQGQADTTSDADLTVQFGKEYEANGQNDLFDKFPDFAAQYRQLSAPKPAAPAPVAAIAADVAPAPAPAPTPWLDRGVAVYDGVKSVFDTGPDNPAPDPNGKTAEGFLKTAGRKLATDIAPALGTAGGGIVGAGLGALAGAPGGLLAIGTAIAGDIAGGAAGGAAVKKVQNLAMGDEWAKDNEAQIEANQRAHPFATAMGEMLPMLISMFGGGGATAVKAGGKVLGKAYTTAGRDALLAGEAADTVAKERIIHAAVTGARMDESRTAQQLVDGKEVTAGDFLNAGVRGALTMGVTGLFAPAQTLLGQALGRSVSDAAAMNFAGAIYDRAVHGTPIDWGNVAKTTAADLPAFVVQNAVMAILHGHAPVEANPTTPEQTSADARRNALNIDQQKPAGKPLAKPALTEQSPLVVAARLFQKDPEGAANRLDVLTKLEDRATESEAKERDALAMLLQKSPPAPKVDTTQGPAGAGSAPVGDVKPGVEGSAPAPVVGGQNDKAATPEVITPAKPLFEVSYTDAADGTTKTAQFNAENAADAVKIANEQFKGRLTAMREVTQAPSAVAPLPVTDNSQVGSPTPSAVTPLVKPTTAGELRIRVQKANSRVEKVFTALRGITPPPELADAQKQISEGTYTEETISRLEQAAATLEQQAVKVAQDRATERQADMNKRAKDAADKARAKQEKANAAAVEKMANQLKKEQAAAFKKDPETAVAELQAERDLAASAGADTKELDTRIADFTAKLPKPKAPLPTGEDMATKVKEHRMSAKGELEVLPLNPAPARFELPIFEHGKDALTGFDLEGFSTKLSARLAENGGEMDAKTAKAVAAMLEQEVTKMLKRKAANKEGAQSDDWNNSSTSRMAIALNAPDGTVIHATLLRSGVPTEKVGSNGINDDGVRVSDMGRKSGLIKSGKDKGKRTNKVIVEGGNAPVLLSDLIARGYVPFDVIHFGTKTAGKFFQKFDSRAQYEATKAATPLSGRHGGEREVSVDAVGGENKFASGGAGATAGAEQIAEQQTAPTETDAHILMVQDWAEAAAAPEGELNKPKFLFKLMARSGGSIAKVREKLAASTAGKSKIMLKWLGEMTDGVATADTALERMYKQAQAAHAANRKVIPEAEFAKAGLEPKAWSGETVADILPPAAPTIEAPKVAELPAPKPEAAPAPVDVSDVTIGEAWSRMSDAHDALTEKKGEGEFSYTDMAAHVFEALAKSKSKKAKAALAEFEAGGVDADLLAKAYEAANLVKVPKKVKGNDEPYANRLAEAQFDAFTKVMNREQGDEARRNLAVTDLTDPALFQFKPASELSNSKDLGEVAASVGNIRVVHSEQGMTLSSNRQLEPGENVRVRSANGWLERAMVVKHEGNLVEIVKLSDRSRSIVPLDHVADPTGIQLMPNGPNRWTTDSSIKIVRKKPTAMDKTLADLRAELGFNPQAGQPRDASTIYQAIYHWAAVNGQVIGEDVATTKAGNYRRNAHQLSSALREGSADHFEPTTATPEGHPYPTHGDSEGAGWNQLSRMGLKSLAEWKALSFNEKVVALARAEQSYIREVEPALDTYGYNWATGQFYEISPDQKHLPISTDKITERARALDLEARANRDRDSIHIGGASARRYLAIRSLLGGEGEKPAKGSIGAGFVTDSLSGILYRETTGENLPEAGRPTIEVADTHSQTQLGVDRLASAGINVPRAANDFFADRQTVNPDGSVTITKGVSYGPHLALVAMNDVAYHGMEGLVTTVHEGMHTLFRQLPEHVRNDIVRAAANAPLRARAEAAAKETGVKLAKNFDMNPEEKIVETMAQEIAARGVPEARSVAEALWRFTKDLYLRAARAVLKGVGVEDGKLIDSLSLAWLDNHMRRTMGGDFEWAFMNIVDRFKPASIGDKVAAHENSDGSTPGNLYNFVDPITGRLMNPSDVRFRDEPMTLNWKNFAPSDGSVNFREVDVDPKTTWHRMEAASFNEITPELDKAKKEASPDMSDTEFWKLIGTGEHPALARDQIETKQPGAGQTRLNGEGMTKAMNEQVSERTYHRLQLLVRTVAGRMASRSERIETAFKGFADKRASAAKTDSEYKNAAVLLENLKTRIKGMAKETVQSISSGMKLSKEAGRLGADIAAAEGRLEGEAIPAEYQAVFKSILDGDIPIFDHLSAISKLGLNLQGMTIQEAKRAIKAAAPTDTRLAKLVENRALFTTLTSLARNSARDMGLLQLRQMGATAEHTAIIKELDTIRTATKEQIDSMWIAAEEMADQTSLTARLRREYLKERRDLRRSEKILSDAARESNILSTTHEILSAKLSELEKSVGNFSAFVVQHGARWTAMKPSATGGWEAIERTLGFDKSDRFMEPERVREDLATNLAYLKENVEHAGTKLYEQVRKQTYELARVNLERESIAATHTVVDEILQDLGSKLGSTGTAGGELLQQMFHRNDSVVKQAIMDLEPMSNQWITAFNGLHEVAAKGEDRQAFFKRVIVPVLYQIESDTGREEAGALREAKAQARARMTGDVSPKFDARLEAFLRQHKEMSEAFLKLNKQYDLHVEDPRLGGQLRNAIAQGWITSPRSLDRGVIEALLRTMDQAGWSIDWKDQTRTDSEGNVIATRKSLGGNTFEGIDMADPELAAKLAAKFTPDVIQRFLEPFIRKPGKPSFFTDRGGIDGPIVEKAWTETKDVLAWIDRLGELSGGIEELAIKNKENPDALPPDQQWRRDMLDRIDGLWAMEKRLVSDTGVVGKGFDPHKPKSHTMMDARLNQDIPPEHLTYAYFSPNETKSRLAELAYHAAFGRNGVAGTAALDSLKLEIDKRANLRNDIWLRETTEKGRRELAKQVGYDYNTLDRSLKTQRQFHIWERQFHALFTPGGRTGDEGLSGGMAVLHTMQKIMLNQPTSGLWNLLSITDFPLALHGFGQTGRAATMIAIKNLFHDGVGSLLQDVGINIGRAAEYSEVGGLVDHRKLNNLEWGTLTADLARVNPDAKGLEAMNNWLKDKAHLVGAALDKGLTPGDVLLRGGKAAKGDFARFSLLTSPFKWLNDAMERTVATTNIQTYELILNRGIKFMADHPELMKDVNYKVTAKDLGMDTAGILGDKGAFDFYKNKTIEYGLGTLEDMIRQAALNKQQGQPMLIRDHAMQLAIMGLQEVALQSSINSRPSGMFTNPVVKALSPMLGWPMAKTNFANQLMKTPEGQATLKAAIKGVGMLALVAVPMGLAFSLGMDQWDQRIRGKRSQLPAIGTDKTARENLVGMLARVARAGNVYGIAADVVAGMASPLDPASGQRQFTLDSRILAFSQLATLGQALSALPQQDWQMTWAGGGRQLFMALGGNGPLQYVQMLNNAGFQVSDAEARVVARQNVYASIRQAAQGAGISVRKGGSAVTPTEKSLWLREMQLAAFNNDRLAFREAYVKAVASLREDGESDPEGGVLRAWAGRDPFRVLDSKPSDLEKAKLFAAMNDYSRRLVQESIHNYELFTALIKPTADESKAKAAAKRAAVSPMDRLLARRAAAGY